MALKPRKQCKHYPYLFLLNEKSFLKYLRGQYLEFDAGTDDEFYYSVDYYQLSKTKEKILEGGNGYKRINMFVKKLTNENKLTYAPVFCSSWIVKNDSEAIKKMGIVIDNNRFYHPKTKEKREARKELRLNTWCCGWMDFQDKSIEDIDLENPMLTHRERKWWQKGYDDAKEDIEQLSNNKVCNQCHGDKF